MIFERYEYKYALIPHAEARKMGLGWRKADADGMVLMNMSEIRQLQGSGTVEERVASMGGRVMTPEEANYYRHTNNFSFVTDSSEPPQEPHPDESPAPVPDDSDNIDPGFTQGGTQTEFPPLTEGDGEGDLDPWFSRDPVPEENREDTDEMETIRKTKKTE